MNRLEDIPADIGTLIRIGTVVSVDLAAARCIVRYGDPDDDDGGAETPPIRWLGPRAGKTRAWSPPSEGEQVVLLSPDGQVGAAVAIAGIVQDAYPPLGTDLVERIEWEDGARMAYDPQTHSFDLDLPDGGTILLRTPGEIAIEAAAGVAITGNVTIDGTLDVSGDIASEADVLAGDTSLALHRHLGVTAGQSISGPPE